MDIITKKMNFRKNEDSDSESEDEGGEIMTVVGKEIWYYGDIERANVLEFTKNFKKLERDLMRDAIEDEKPTVKIYICSGGGDVFAGMAVMDTLLKSKLNVITVAHGECCSAATLFLMGGNIRRVSQNAYILIHQISTGTFWGKFEDLKDEMKTCEKLMRLLRKIYNKYTKLPEKKLNKLLKRDIYLDADESIKFGVVHGID